MRVRARHRGQVRRGTLSGLEDAFLKGLLDRREFIFRAAALGLSLSASGALAESLADAKANQEARAAKLPSCFDYIVCGAGSSGCVVAARLVHAGKSVLLVEAGGWDDAESILNPRLHSMNLGTSHDWDFNAEPEQALAGRSIKQHMGKVLGGGSSINAMIWTHGHKNDYDFWAQAAMEQRWGYSNLLPLWNRIEDWQGNSSAFRGREGAVKIEPAANPNPVATAFLDAARELGFPILQDINGDRTVSAGGFGLQDLNVFEARRQNLAVSYVYPVLSASHFTLLLDTSVQRVLIDNGRSVGVRVLRRGEEIALFAREEVIICLGAINSPKALMLSGIGPADSLRSHGIPVAAHSPDVGQNLQDHILHGGVLFDAPELQPFSYGGSAAAGFLKSDSGLDTPDLNIVQAEVPYASPEVRDKYGPTAKTWALATGLVGPKSRGHVTLQSANPADAPRIDSNLLTDPADLSALIKGIKVCRELGRSKALRAHVSRELAPGPLVTKEELIQFARIGALSYQHESGTCRMGGDSGAVVDGQLNVRGVEGLRVADGSIMPRIVQAPTMASCALIGERAADFILGT